jgi:hypothetical protein
MGLLRPTGLFKDDRVSGDGPFLGRIRAALSVLPVQVVGVGFSKRVSVMLSASAVKIPTIARSKSKATDRSVRFTQFSDPLRPE